MKNINKTFKYMAMAAAALPMGLSLLTSCSNEENDEIHTRSEVKFTTAISGAIESRADADYTPVAGELTLYYSTLGGTQKATYGYGENGWAYTGVSNPLYWEDLEKAQDGSYTFYAVAPLQEYGEVLADQRAATDLEASDLLMARTVATDAAQPVRLVLKHLMGKMVVNVLTTADSETALTEAEMASVAVSIAGLKTAYTVAAGSTADVPATATASGDANTGLIPNKVGNAYSYIAPAQTLAGMKLSFTVTYGDTPRTYVYEVPAGDNAPGLAAGTITTFNITISKTKLALGGVTVTDWATGTTASATLAVTVDGTADELTDNTGSINELFITPFAEKQIDKTYEAANAPYTYTKGDDGTWSSANPLYLDALTANSVLYALAYNKDAEGKEIQDALTNLYDFVGTDAVSVKGGAAAFNLRHLQAQMTVKLVAGTGFTSSLDGAAIVTPTMVTAAQLGTDTDGNMAMKPTATSTGTYTVASGATHLVVPQTLAVDAVFTVTLTNGNSYEAKLAEAVSLEAGKNTTVTLTLTPTRLGVSAAVTAWGEAAAAATVQLAGTSSEIGITGVTEQGSLALTYVQNDALTESSATFGYDGTAWSNATPLYWDEIAPAASYTFAALFTPEDARVEKDYLVGVGTATNHGAQVALDEMKHAMAKMTIKLQPGTGVTEDELKALTTQLTLYMSSSVAVKADGTANITLKESASTIAYTSKTEYSLFVAPQELKDGSNDYIQLTRGNGNIYKIKLTGLTDGAETPAAIFTDSKIEAGKHYQITLTVNETGVGITASIAPWTNVEGSGEMKPEF